MAETFPLELVTPTGIAYQGEVVEVTAWNPLGQFGVLAEHINFITSLVPGIVEVKLADGGMLYYVVSGGLAEVKDGKMTILADSAEEPAADRPRRGRGNAARDRDSSCRAEHVRRGLRA